MHCRLHSSAVERNCVCGRGGRHLHGVCRVLLHLLSTAISKAPPTSHELPAAFSLSGSALLADDDELAGGPSVGHAHWADQGARKFVVGLLVGLRLHSYTLSGCSRYGYFLHALAPTTGLRDGAKLGFSLTGLGRTRLGNHAYLGRARIRRGVCLPRHRAVR